MDVPFLDIVAQDRAMLPAILARFQQICGTGGFILGPEVEQFERAFATYCEAEHCVALNSGTSALHLALLVLGIGPGDEVILPAMTFVATAWGVSYVGATPVFVDIDPIDRTLDVRQLAQALTPRTKAIIPVHLYGLPAQMEPLLAFAQQHELAVVEDAAQAHGARYKNQRVGALGDLGCFSFYPGKNLGAFGEGGAVVTQRPEYAERMRQLRNHAQKTRYYHEELGFNFRMDALQGAALLEKLPHLDGWNERRRQIAQRYQTRLADAPGLRLPRVTPDRESVFHLFVVESARRSELAAKLKERGVQTGLHYPVPVHLQQAYADLGYLPGSFPSSERLGNECLSLPMSPVLSDAQVDYVCEAVWELSEQLHETVDAGADANAG